MSAQTILAAIISRSSDCLGRQPCSRGSLAISCFEKLANSPAGYSHSAGRLITTTAFAALAVRTLNLVSVTFAVIFVGIAVDFSVQFAVGFRAAQASASTGLSALEHTGRRIGLPILVAAAATATGFLAYVPTSFTGVGEIRLIAGGGMLIAFIYTIAFLPAALTISIRFRDALQVEAAG